MQTITLQSIIEAKPDILATNMGDETVLLSPQTGTYFGLNSVGQRILELVREPRALEEVVHQLSSEYEVEPQRLEGDVLGFVEDLARHGIVTASEAV